LFLDEFNKFVELIVYNAELVVDLASLGQDVESFY
jgi:hypothetical protein